MPLDPEPVRRPGAMVRAAVECRVRRRIERYTEIAMRIVDHRGQRSPERPFS
ncbi:hypothetical protein [Pseudonocardia acidicola]|uniref:Uncharacterized protein n=1 Tax=Pseudonocardia acidicola TaxID=2724939 RepID=A0ABX1S2G6_9PSEU|nr:hypothetical protein [Pseudonocardia acidicola]NMH95751.1 hypothetical protein [Pseudonocardia acidicola]